MDVATAAVGAAGFLGCFDLFRRPDVRLRQLDPAFCAGNLALVTLRNSIVHTLHYTLDAVLQGTARALLIPTRRSDIVKDGPYVSTIRSLFRPSLPDERAQVAGSPMYYISGGFL